MCILVHFSPWQWIILFLKEQEMLGYVQLVGFLRTGHLLTYPLATATKLNPCLMS